MEKIFDGVKEEKLGTAKNPAKVSVQTEKRNKEVTALFIEHDWEFEITVDADKPEDITDLDILLNKPQPVKVKEKIGRNDPCSCGSGKKYKKCCGK